MAEVSTPAVVKVETCHGLDYGYRNRETLDPLSWLAAQGTSEIRHDIGAAANDILRQVADGNCENMKAIGDAECRLSNRMADDFGKLMLHTANMERDLQNQIHS